MSDISFKKFAKFVAIEGEPTDEQITEIFGMFQNNAKVDALKARKAELDAKKKKLAQQHADALMAKAAKQHRDNGGFDPKEKGSGTIRSAAAAGRAADNDWVRGMVGEEHLAEAFRHLNGNRIRTLDHFGSASEAPEERRMLVKALALLGKSLPEDKVFTYDQNGDAKIFVRLMRANKVANPDKPGVAEFLRAGFEKAKRLQGLTFLTKDGIVAVVNEDGPTKLIMAA